VTAIAFDPVQSKLATGGDDGTIRIWDLSADDPSVLPLVLRCEVGVNSIDYSADGRHLSFAMQNGQIGVWLMDVHELIDLARATAGRELRDDEREAFLPLSNDH
jgi:WD40 repeat protein